MRKLSKSQVITLLIFFILILLRLPGLDNSPAEYQSWRQSDTEAIARNLLEQRFNIFYPQLNYDGPWPNYAQLEFQITPFLIAMLYRLFGYHYFLARLIPLLFFSGSAYFLYKVGREIGGELTGWLTLAIYGVFPFCIFFSRAIMPESAALFFMVAGFYYFLGWLKNKKNWATLVLSAGLTALAISQKIPTIYIGIPMAYLVLSESGGKAFKNPYVWSYILIALLPPFCYFAWLQGIAENDYVLGIAESLLLPTLNQQLCTPSGVTFLKQALPRAYTPLGLWLALGGLSLAKDRKSRFLISWALAAALEILFVAAKIQLDYYLILAAPIVALLVAVLLNRLCRSRLGRVCLVGLLVLNFSIYWPESGFYFQQNQEILNQARAIQEYTANTDLLVVGTYSPELLNLSHRYGWRANIFYPQEPGKELAYFMANKAHYFVTVNGQVEGDEDGQYFRYLQKNYQELTLTPGVSIFKLQ